MIGGPDDLSPASLLTGRADGVARQAESRLANGGDGKALAEATRRLEGVFLNMVFEEMAKSVPKEKLLGGAAGHDMVHAWLRREISDRWAESGGLGLSRAVVSSLGGDPLAAGDPSTGRGVPPVVGRVTSPYGPRTHPVTGEADMHHGVDVAVPEGTPVRAPFGGRVVRVGDHPTLGRMVVVEHAGGYRTLLGHNRRVIVEEGQTVAAGAVVAESGQSGRATGPHVHVSMYRDGHPVDPRRWILGLESVDSPTHD